MTFRVGQKVICVDASGGFINNLGDVIDTNELTLGAVYTVRWVGLHDDDRIGIRVAGVVRGNPPKGYTARNAGEDVPFDAVKFRHIVERKTDITVFTKMLNRRKVSV